MSILWSISKVPWDTEAHNASGWIAHIGKLLTGEVGNGGLQVNSSPLSWKVSHREQVLKSSSILSWELSVFITAGLPSVCAFDNWAQRLNQLDGASRKLDSDLPRETLERRRARVADPCLESSAWPNTHGILPDSPVSGDFPISVEHFLLNSFWPAPVPNFHGSVLKWF